MIRLSLACLIFCLGTTVATQNTTQGQDRNLSSVREVAPKEDTITEESVARSEAGQTLGTTTEESTTPVRTTPAFKPFRIENTSTRAQRKAMRQARKGKSRRKRRGCKCVSRYMQDVEKMIDTKIKHFKDMYLVPKLKETNSQRMSDSLLRLSGTVDETKKGLMKLTESVSELLDDFQARDRNLERTNRQLHRIGSAVANLSKHVDIMEQRIASSGVKASRLRARHPHDSGASQNGGFETSTPAKPLPTQCDDVFKSGSMHFLGEYYVMIQPRGVPHSFKALCKVVDNSGWTVIQKRQDGSVDFYRAWDDYRVGFGTLEGEFWLGNDNIHYLTSQEDTMLRIEMEDWAGKKYLAVYDHFKVDGARDNFRLHISGYHGTAGDAMNSEWEDHDGQFFSTKDRDNDDRYYDSCAQQYQGAWWFNNCFEAHLNGKYYTKGFHKNYFQRDGIQWNTIHMYSSLKAVQMMVKPADKPAQDVVKA